ncbi:MAG: class I SAM-dependent methyltransferase [Caulobacteraceae bacterium]|nr:class I SAM-dependent methyltransferase [Caulobacteraceae bacterium]
MDVGQVNREGWDRRVEAADVWTVAVDAETIARARAGDWAIHLTANRPTPADWLGDVAGRDVLCLASGGGQQGPTLAAAGARVVVFDASARQLAQDEAVARREGLDLTIRQGFMHDLSGFANAAFDLIFHPVSNCYAPQVEPVWRECFRVLRPGGVLLAGFMNPMVYVFDPDAEARGELVARFRLPYSDIADRDPETLAAIIARDHTVEFSHSLEAQIGGQLRAGFLLTGLFEDTDRGDASMRSRWFPTMIATRAVKP